ncbi:hypothetical protein ACFV06_36110 [Streptomyces sp. NPDC059618]|uniref:hypothetical protein n=1 Tax=Streptomyces sp. NPDC059618 TaxID=3346887 RepID=UPI00369D0511
MRRTARVLYATALAGAALGAAASGAVADPAAEVSPGSVEPGGTVTVTVSCDAIGGTPPDSIDASSQGFQEGKVQLHRVDGAGGSGAGAASYSGTAHISSGGPDQAPDSTGQGSDAGRGFDELSPGTLGSGASDASDAKNSDAAGAAVAAAAGPDAVSPAAGSPNAALPDAQAPLPGAGDPAVPGASDPATDGEDPVGPGTVGPDSTGPDDLGPDSVGPDTVPDPADPGTVGPDTTDPGTAGSGTVGPDRAGPDRSAPDSTTPDATAPDTGGADGRWNVGGVCPAPPGGHGKQWTASYAVGRGATATRAPDDAAGTGTGAGDRPPTVQRGVEAGEGGVFTDSVPALVTGGVLIAGAVGAAVYQLRGRRRRRA